MWKPSKKCDPLNEKMTRSMEIGASSGSTKSVNYVCDNQTRVYLPGSIEEKKIVRLIDLHMLPCICLLYFLNYLDRSNIGNAEIGGMSKDLDLSATDYSWAVMTFSVAYVLAEVPSNMFLSRMRPSRFLATITFSWGLVATCFGLVQTKGALIGIRFVLGLVESGFFPGVIFYLSSWYRRDELAKRIGIFYTSGIISGAFGGIISGSVMTNLDGVRGIQGWRWLFMIEGLATILASLMALFFLPDWPSNTKWLTLEQRALAKARLEADTPSWAKLDVPLTHFQAFKGAVGDWRTWVFCFMYTMITTANSASYFIPTIVTTLGYTGQKAQFMTVPVHSCAVVSILINSISADYFNNTNLNIAIPSLISGVVYAVGIKVTDPTARYGLLCVGFGAIHGPLPVVLVWLSQELGNPGSKRAVCQALVNTVGTFASIYGSFFWTSPPKFTMGYIAMTTSCLLCTASVAVAQALFSKFPPRDAQLNELLNEKTKEVEG